MSKTTDGTMFSDAQPQTTDLYPNEPTVELPLALVDLLSVFAGGHQLAQDAHQLGDNERLAQVGWALFKELGEYTPDDESALSEIDVDGLLVKHAGQVGYSFDELDVDDVEVADD